MTLITSERIERVLTFGDDDPIFSEIIEAICCLDAAKDAAEREGLTDLALTVGNLLDALVEIELGAGIKKWKAG